MNLAPGARIGERFAVEALLGEGGSARVYRVRHTALGSVHALKLLDNASGMSPERLLQEGRIQAALRHPCIVPVTDVVWEGGELGLVMEYVPGPSLADVLERTRLDEETALALFARVLAGVDSAHEAGVLHRDLKPHNVLLAPMTGGWMPKVADFGIARPEEAPEASRRTRVGFTLGTPGYMPPEQAHGARDLDRRVDVYALGVVLYEMLTGELPAPDHFGAPPPDPAKVRERLGGGVVAAAVAKAMEADRAQRFADVPGFAGALYDGRPELFAVAVGATPPGPVAIEGELAAVPVPRVATDETIPVTSPTIHPPPEAAMRAAPTLAVSDLGPPSPPPGRPAWVLPGAVFGGLLTLALLATVAWLVFGGRSGGGAEPLAVAEPAGAAAGAEPGGAEALASGAALPEGAAALTGPASEAGTAAGTGAAPSAAAAGASSAAAPTTAEGAPAATSTDPTVAATAGAPASPAATSATEPGATTAASPTPDAPSAPPSTDPASTAPSPNAAAAPSATTASAPAEASLAGTPAAAPPDVRGTWAGTLGGRPLELVITGQQGERVSARLTLTFGTTDRTLRFAGTVDADGGLSLLEEGGSGRLVGRLAGGRVTGTVTTSGGKPQAFSAARQ